MARTYTCFCLGALFALSACGSSDGSKSGASTVDAGTPSVIGAPGSNDGSGGMNGGMAAGADASSDSTKSPREYLSFVRRRTVPDNADQPVIADIVVYDFKDKVEINLTGGLGEVDCISRLCAVNPELTWVAWLDPDRNQLKVAPIDLAKDRVVTEQTRVVEENIDRVDFMTYRPESGDPIELLVYSKASSGAREVFVEPAAGFDEAACASGGPMCRTPVGTVNQSGAFRVTKNGDLIILIDIDLGSMTLKLFNLTTGAQTTIYQFGDEMADSSQWSGRLPVGLSPDAQFLIVGTNNDKMWRLNKVPIGNNPELTIKELFEVRNELGADGKAKACARPADAAYWEVMLNPLFTQDSEWVYFLVHGDCTGGSRQDYDIMRIKSDLSGDWENITKTKGEFYAAHHQINYFDLSTDGSKLVFVSEKPNMANSDSIWLVDATDGTYDCSRSDNPAGQRETDGKDYCEFITFEGLGGQVNHQHVRFHYR